MACPRPCRARTRRKTPGHSPRSPLRPSRAARASRQYAPQPHAPQPSRAAADGHLPDGGRWAVVPARGGTTAHRPTSQRYSGGALVGPQLACALIWPAMAGMAAARSAGAGARSGSISHCTGTPLASADADPTARTSGRRSAIKLPGTRSPGLDDGEGGGRHRHLIVLDGDSRAGRGEHADAGLTERQPDGFAAEVRRDPQPSPPDQQPARLLVEIGAHPVEPGIGQLGPGPAQRDQLAVPGQDAEVRLAVELGPVELGAQEGGLILRVGYVGSGPAVPGELVLASLGDRLGEPRARCGR